ncbi:CENPB DNA-binding domain containing protein 1-like 18 [Homarus americanus]|uniref:CENPB DNA-binding domain containing protein 1-like 18 n=1 Tax=Homarus americanus TaxID=6706 RepID=A0A8J5TJJ3_HOMAM|nr:CENPB DNA-binding domain containing protein 1-like 18 [Homarus americanus]
MAPKRRGNASTPKKSRKVMTLAKKIKILDRLCDGAHVAKLACENSVNESTIRTIRSCEDKICASVKASASLSAKAAQVPRRDHYLEKMEKILNIWISG